jgi:hypothetical protein
MHDGKKRIDHRRVVRQLIGEEEEILIQNIGRMGKVPTLEMTDYFLVKSGKTAIPCVAENKTVINGIEVYERFGAVKALYEMYLPKGTRQDELYQKPIFNIKKRKNLTNDELIELLGSLSEKVFLDNPTLKELLISMKKKRDEHEATLKAQDDMSLDVSSQVKELATDLTKQALEKAGAHT